MKSEENKKNGYALSRQWFDFALNNPEKVNTNHAALYFWIVELNNKLLWKEVIGLPTLVAMGMIGIRDRRYFRKTLSDLEEWGFIKLISKSRNQYACNRVALLLKTEADNSAYVTNTHAKTKVRWEKRNSYQTIFDEEEAKKKCRTDNSAYALNTQAKCMGRSSTDIKESFAYAPDAPINNKEEDKPTLNKENPYSEEPNPLGSEEKKQYPSFEEFKNRWDKSF